MVLPLAWMDTMTLDEAIAALEAPRCQVFIISDGCSQDDWPANPIAPLPPDAWFLYDVEDPQRLGDHSVTYRSRQAEARFPDHSNVAIRVELLRIWSPVRDSPSRAGPR